MKTAFRNSLVTMVISAVIIGYAAVAYLRNAIYLTPIELWKATAAAAGHKQRPHENYGQALSTAGFYMEALREFETVQAMPSDGSVPMRDLYREIGVVYFRLNMIDEAIVAWKKGLVYADYDPGLMNNLALAFLKKGQYVEAEAYAKQGLITDVAMPTLLNTLGEVAMQNRDYGQAVEYFLKVLEINPDDTSGAWNTALAYAQNGQYEKAQAYVNRYLARESAEESRQQALALLHFLNEKLDRQ
jgi:tetratricopeptide (TPR) repeat protein